NVATGSNTVNFEVGSGSNYTPASIAFASVTNAGTLTVSTTGSDHPQIASSGLDSNHTVNRYWTLTLGGSLAGGTYTPTFTFVSGDVDLGSTTSTFIVKRYASSTWNSTTSGSTHTSTQTSTAAINVSSGFGDFAIGNVVVTPPTFSTINPTSAGQGATSMPV